jgi:hypothetical protein
MTLWIAYIIYIVRLKPIQYDPLFDLISNFQTIE